MTGPTAGTLYVVATPIGNLEDITARARRILSEVDIIACEDTRHTRKLLSRYEIHTDVVSYHRHNEAARCPQIIQRLRTGDDVALVSDAGAPCISDPGHVLVAAAVAAGIEVRAVPGPSALTAALTVAGLPVTPFTFFGFVPTRAAERRALLTSLRQVEHTLVFYESPRRLGKFLADCAAVLGSRQVVVCKELTKIHETCLRGALAEVLERVREMGTPKGEYVVLIAGAEPAPAPEADETADLLRWYRDHSGLSLKDSVRKLAADLGLSRSRLYGEALDVWAEDEGK